MRKSGRLLLVLTVPLLLGSRCSVVGVGEEPRDLRAARERWVDAGIEDYTFDLRRSCFCGMIDPVRIVVRDGVPVSHTLIASREALAEEDRRWFPPIEGLFEVVEDAIDRGAYRLDVRYDSARGYPIEISIDYERNVADEEVAYTVSTFKVD